MLHHFNQLAQVPGCTADLAAEPKLYCLRKRICMKHMQVRIAAHAHMLTRLLQ